MRFDCYCHITIYSSIPVFKVAEADVSFFLAGLQRINKGFCFICRDCEVRLPLPQSSKRLNHRTLKKEVPLKNSHLPDT